MKKGLLILSAVAVSITSAQAQGHKFTQFNRANQPQELVKLNADCNSIAPLRSKASRRADGTATLMYSFPSGAFFYGLTNESYSYSAMQALTGAFEDVEFTNYSYLTDADGNRTRLTDITWDWGVSSSGNPITPISQRVNERGSVIAQGFGSYPFPTLLYGDQQFQYEITDEDDATKTYSAYWNAGTEGIANFAFGDGQGGVEYHDGSVGNACPSLGLYAGFGGDYAFISNSTFYDLENYSTTRTWNNTGKKLVGFAEYYSKPAGHVYAESVVAWFFCSNVADNTKALDGKTLTATVYTFGENGMEPFATATAKDEDVTFVTTGGLCYIDFKFTEEDPIMGTVDAPVVLPNEDFIVILSGFDQVSSTFKAPFAPSDGFAGNGYALLEDGSLKTIGYTNDPTTPQLNLFIGFRAAFPVAKYSDENLPKVVFTAEGGLGAGIVDEEDNSLLGYSVLYTFTPKDEWVLIDAPAWVSYELDDQYLQNGVMILSLTAEALPEGTDKRDGEMVFEIYGKQVVVPVVQSVNPDAELGINGVTMNAGNTTGKTYNLMGQQVNRSAAKGLLIRDGKKFMSK